MMSPTYICILAITSVIQSATSLLITSHSLKTCLPRIDVFGNGCALFTCNDAPIPEARWNKAHVDSFITACPNLCGCPYSNYIFTNACHCPICSSFCAWNQACSDPTQQCVFNHECPGGQCESTLVKQFQNPAISTVANQVTNPMTNLQTVLPFSDTTTSKPVPIICAKIGEQCSSQYTRGSHCCDDHTKCRFDNYDKNSLIGVCCIEHHNYGCVTDTDCCTYDAICTNGYCERNLSPNINDNINANNAAAAVDIMGKLLDNNNGNENENQVDMHERNRSKPNYDVWISLTANTIMLYIVLLMVCVGFCCWYKKNVKRVDIMDQTMSVPDIMVEEISVNDLSHVVREISNLECDIDTDNLDSDSDELMYSSSREL